MLLRLLIWFSPFVLLLVIALVYGQSVASLWHTRNVVICLSDELGYSQTLGHVYWQERDLLPAIGELGGQDQATRQLARYLKLPAFLAPRQVFAVRMMRACGVPGHRTLMLLLGTGSREVKAAAAKTLGWVDGPVTPIFLDNSGRDDIRDAISLPETIDDPECREALIAALRDENRDVRGVAATALGVMRQRDARPALEAILRGDPDPQVRRVAGWAIGRIGDVQN